MTLFGAPFGEELRLTEAQRSVVDTLKTLGRFAGFWEPYRTRFIVKMGRREGKSTLAAAMSLLYGINNPKKTVRLFVHGTTKVEAMAKAIMRMGGEQAVLFSHTGERAEIRLSTDSRIIIDGRRSGSGLDLLLHSIQADLWVVDDAESMPDSMIHEIAMGRPSGDKLFFVTDLGWDSLDSPYMLKRMWNSQDWEHVSPEEPREIHEALGKSVLIRCYRCGVREPVPESMDLDIIRHHYEHNDWHVAGTDFYCPDCKKVSPDCMSSAHTQRYYDALKSLGVRSELDLGMLEVVVRALTVRASLWTKALLFFEVSAAGPTFRHTKFFDAYAKDAGHVSRKELTYLRCIQSLLMGSPLDIRTAAKELPDDLWSALRRAMRDYRYQFQERRNG